MEGREGGMEGKEREGRRGLPTLCNITSSNVER